MGFLEHVDHYGANAAECQAQHTVNPTLTAGYLHANLTKLMCHCTLIWNDMQFHIAHAYSKVKQILTIQLAHKLVL